MTIEEVRERLAYWQRVLRLQDWDLGVVFVDQRDLPSMTHRATIEQQRNYRRALIRIADPETARFENRDFHAHFGSDDIELSLVHELVHLLMPVDGMPEDAEEYAVEAIAKTVLALDRRGRTSHLVDVSTHGTPHQFIEVPAVVPARSA